MTEKRFHFGYVLGDTGLIDEQATDGKWFIENCCSCSDLKKNWITVCNKLNEVADENEQLQIKIADLQYDNKNYKINLNDQKRENKELKQRNNRQAKQLDRLYNLIEQKDWRALNDILDDFKKCDEQLQKEWGTYGDVE